MRYETRIKRYSEFEYVNDYKQKVGLITQGNYIASNYIRIFSPFSNISKDFEPYVVDERDFFKFKQDLESDFLLLDIIIVQRDVLDWEFTKLLVDKCKLFGVKLIFEIDDDIINMEKSSPIYHKFVHKIPAMRFLAQNADCITVSTDVLKIQMDAFNDNVIVIPNALSDYWALDFNYKLHDDSNIIKIGYMGTRTHTKDLKIIIDAIKNIQKILSDKQVIFEIIEGTTEDIDDINIIRVPLDKSYYPDFVPWLQDAVDWDIAIAPLVKEDKINLSKSELKYLEYTALNVPAIYSDVGPYSKAIIHEKNGMLVKNNTTKEWEENLLKLINDFELRQSILYNAINDVKTNYTIKNLMDNWLNVLNSNKRNKSDLLYAKVMEYYDNEISSSFNTFLVNQSKSIVEQSGLFDDEFYIESYPDVLNCGLSPIDHYLTFGVDENCIPFNDFKDCISPKDDFINKFGLNPFVFYLLYGAEFSFFNDNINADNYEINEFIIKKSDLLDAEYYLSTNQDVRDANLNPIYHYSKYGYYTEYRNPSASFSNKYYTTKYLVDTKSWNPLTHYFLIGKEKGLKTNCWSFSNNQFLNEDISRIIDNLNNEVHIILPIHNYSEKIIDCIQSIFNNTFNSYNLIIFIDKNLFEKEFNDCELLFEDNIKIIYSNNDNLFDDIDEFILGLNSDFVLLNSYTEVSYNWLTKLMVKAYADPKIGFVSPCSNFMSDISPFSESSTHNDYMLVTNGINTFLRKSSNHDLIYSSISDAFCLYVKFNFSKEFLFNKNLFVFDSKNNSCYLPIHKGLHIIDDSTYIYHDNVFFEDNYHLFDDHVNDFFSELKLNKFLKSSVYSDFKRDLDLAILDKRDYTLSNRILYILTEEEFCSFKDYLGYYCLLYYDCYFLTSNDDGFKLWDNFNLIQEWDLKLNIGHDELRNELFRDFYFNILFLLNINIIHVINFKNNSFDLLDMGDLLNINLILNCNDDYLICPFKGNSCFIHCDFKNCNSNIFKNILSNWQVNVSELLSNSNLIIDKNWSMDYNSFLNNSNGVVKNIDFPKLNNKLIDTFNNEDICLTLLFVGDIDEREIKLIDNIKKEDLNNNLDLHFLSDNSNLAKYGIYHGLFDIDRFSTISKDINPDFVVLVNKFLGFYDVIFQSKNMCVPVLLDSNNFGSFAKEYYHTYDIPMYFDQYSYSGLFNLGSSEKYYEIIRKLHYPDENIKNMIINITRCFSELYAISGDNSSKEIMDDKPFSNSGIKNDLILNFNQFLVNSYLSPIIHAPFTEYENRCFSIMNNIAIYLKNKSQNIEFKPLVSIIMPVYNRADIVLNAVGTVLNQTYENLELIIVDDASTDDTVDVLKSISDERVNVICSKINGGSSAARNIGLSKANGDYILYLDSDNEWEYNYIDAVMGAFLELPDADAIYSGQFLYRNLGDSPFAVRFGSLNKSLLLNGNYIDLNCLAHKKTVYDKLGGFDESLNRLVDWDFVLKISNYFKLYSVPFILSKYYFDAAKNRISDYSSKNHEKMMELFKNYAHNIHNNNIIIKKPYYQLNKKIKVIIHNIESLIDIHEAINRLFKLNLDDMLEIVVIDNNLNNSIKEYLNYLELNNGIEVLSFVDDDFDESSLFVKLRGLYDVNFDLLVLDVNAVLTKGAIEFMQKYAYELSDSGMVVSQQILPDGDKDIKSHVPYANPYFKCDITPSIVYDNIINLEKYHDGKILELNWAPLFCVYLKSDVLDSFQFEVNNSFEDLSLSNILSDYVRYVKGLKIYHISDAFVYNIADKNIFDWGD